MRSGRIAVLALAMAALVAIASGGFLLKSAERPAINPVSTPVDAVALGRFVPVSPPRAAPKVSFTDFAEQTVNLADFAGKVVLLNLWATWCAPCRHEMPSLAQLQSRFGDKIAILAVSEDIGGKKVVAPFIAKLGLTAIKTYLDPKSRVGQAFNVDGLPTSFLIDRQGRVIGRVEGEADWSSAKMLAVIKPLLGQGDIVKTSLPPAHP